ncbi:MAG: lipoate--protein ligase family protein [Chloroflexota bacterium]|nr:lipoate--protein ligase family protein [Chloroflexota bacterium]
MKSWHLIRSGRQNGAYNMALDEALLQNYAHSLEKGEEPAPTLRFYGWQPPCLTLGYAQRAEREVDFEGCARLGVDWVRRPTGGRAILHDWGELTYSLTALVHNPFLQGGILDSYRQISGALVEGLRRLGVDAETAGREVRGEESATTAACFDAPSAYEITFGGRKLIGSAQARRSGALLQQGTILLTVDVPRLFTVLKPPPRQTKEAAIAQVTARLTSIEEARHRSVSFEEAESAFAAAFAAHFQVALVEDSVRPAEEALTAQLLQEKYANPAWNLERQRPRPAFR